MITEIGKATAATMAPKNNIQNESYPNCHVKSSSKRQEAIAHRLAQIPKAYKGIYKKAIERKSRKAAMHAFCLECCGWQINEVFACTDPGCSLYPYRPKSRVSQEAPEGIPDELEPAKSENKGPG